MMYSIYICSIICDNSIWIHVYLSIYMCIIYICSCLKVYRPSICIFFEVEDNESLQIWSGKKRSNEPGPNMIVRKMSLIGITTVRVTAPKLGSHFAKEELHPPRTSIFHHFSVAVYQLLPLGVFLPRFRGGETALERHQWYRNSHRLRSLDFPMSISSV